MKKMIIGLSVLLCACGGAEKKEAGDLADSIRINLVPKLDGIWVMNDYLKLIEENHSPRLSSAALRGAVCLVIDKYSMRNDSMVAGVNLNNHEGSPFTIFFSYGQDNTQLQTNLGKVQGKNSRVEIGYQRTETGKIFLTLYTYNEKNELEEQRFFSKVADKQMDEDLSYGIDIAVNLRLFKGRFAYTDETGKSDTVEFREDGKMKGFADNKFYFIKKDFNEPFSNEDAVSFFPDGETERPFGFRLVSGNIDLYQLDSVADKQELRYGKKIYSLIRQPG
jgi:hypothetical protein